MAVKWPMLSPKPLLICMKQASFTAISVWSIGTRISRRETYTYVEKDEDGNITLEEERDYISIATTRPETMLGDGAVAVHPKDERYAPIVGKMVRLPLADRLIPIITDMYPDPEFGSGAVKITGAHDFNDYMVAKRNNIPMYSLMGPQGEMIASEIMPEKYVGMDRFKARKAVVADIDAEGYLIKVEDKKIQQPIGDRSGVVIEPLLTDQWFVDAEKLAGEAIAAVERGHGEGDKNSTRFIPENWKKTYDHWMANIQPWCISRPVGYVRDEDVLDTWFSSGLWPFSTLGWPDNTEELARFYPTSTLVTAFDIIFFWVARMMMQGLHFMKDEKGQGVVPFKDVYIHALVLDEHGKKMSKAIGNTIDPLDLIEGVSLDELVAKRTRGLKNPNKASQVEKATRKAYPDGFDAYGADALRFALASQAGQGRNIRLSVDRIAGYRNFGTKLWSAASFGQMNGCVPTDFDPASATLNLNKWIISELVKTAGEVSRYIEAYRFNDAADAVYKFTWDTFCAWYLELSKAILSGDAGPEKTETQATFAWVLDQILKLLHPFMPFITEELWANLGAEREAHLIVSDWPELSDGLINEEAVNELEWLMTLVTNIRSVRADMNIPPAKKAPLLMLSDTLDPRLATYAPQLSPMARVEHVELADKAPDAALQTVVEGVQFAIPLAGLIDMDAERKRLNKEIEKAQSEIDKIDKKLGNEAFVSKAPEKVVNMQKERRAGYVEEVETLKAALAGLT